MGEENMVHIHNGILSVHTKTLLFTKTQADLENIMLSKKSHTQKK